MVLRIVVLCFVFCGFVVLRFVFCGFVFLRGAEVVDAQWLSRVLFSCSFARQW